MDSSRFRKLNDLIADEVVGLTDEQLDWVSERWEWSQWSIRRNLSHIANTFFKAIMLQIGDQIWPDGDAPQIPDLHRISSSPGSRHLDDERYWELVDILEKVREGIELVEMVLAKETAISLEQKSITGEVGAYMRLLHKHEPQGIRFLDDTSNRAELTLGVILKLLYYEAITHLYNIQRLKRAQRLPTVSVLPEEGFWTLPGWDRSEPD